MKKLAFLVLALSLFGCGSSLMQTRTASSAPPRPDKAVVTFLRPSIFGGAIRFGLWDGDELVGVLTARSYIQYSVKPGPHIFMARAENWSYVKADLEAGKNYYILGKVFPGFWKARCALDPVKKEDSTTQQQIDKWLRELTPIEIIPGKAEAYAQPRVQQVREAVNEFKAGKVKFEVLEAGDGR